MFAVTFFFDVTLTLSNWKATVESMASIKSVYNEFGSLQFTIETCIKRCNGAPFPSAEREGRINSVRQELTDIIKRADAVYADLTKEVQADVLAKTAEVERAQAALSSAQELQRESQLAFNVDEAELMRHYSVASADQKQAIMEQRQRLQNEFYARNGASGEEISRLQPPLARLQHEQNSLRVKFDRDAEKIRAKECPEALSKVLDEAKALVDKAGLLEQEIGARAAAALVREVKVGFATNAKSFEAAESFHRGQARILFFAMLAVGVCACVLIYCLFVAINPSALNSVPGPNSVPIVSQTLLIVEHIVMIATGRIALLVMVGLALKYLANLHQMHAEQSVIYRDRLAALGVAENILVATPELDQRRDMLKSLANVYLDFNESAFGRRRREVEEAEAINGVDVQIKRMKRVTEAVAPLFEPVAKIVDKTKGKSD